MGTGVLVLNHAVTCGGDHLAVLDDHRARVSIGFLHHTGIPHHLNRPPHEGFILIRCHGVPVEQLLQSWQQEHLGNGNEKLWLCLLTQASEGWLLAHPPLLPTQ